MAVAATAGVAAAAVVVAEEMANAKQTVEADAKTQQSTIKKQKNGSEDDGISGVAAVSRERCDGCGGSQGNGGGQRGGGAAEETAATVVVECSRESWSNTNPNNDSGGGGGGGVGGGGGGEKNHHTPFSYWWGTVILPDCTDSRGRVLDIVHCHRVSGGGVGGIGGGAHPSDDRKDDNESSGRGSTHHHSGDCDDVVRYRHRHITRGCDQDYDDGDNNAGHTTLLSQRDRGSAPLLPPLLPLLSVGGTVLLICAHP